MLDPMRKYAQSWGTKIVFGLIIIVFVFWGVGSFRGDKASVLAVVNGEPVLIKDYEKAYQENLRLVKNKNPNITDKELQDGGFRQQVFSNMVTTRLLEEQAKKLGVAVSVDELRAEIAKIPAFANEAKQFDPKRYEAILSANGVTPGEFEADFRQNLLMEKLASFIGLPATVTDAEARTIFDFMREQAVIRYIAFKTEDFAKAVTPSSEEIAKYYESKKDEFATPVQIKIDYAEFTPKALAKPAEISDADIEAAYASNQKKYAKPEQVRVRHFLIMLPPDAPKEAIDAAEAKLKDIAEKLRKGVDFATLAPKNPAADGMMSEDWAWLPKGSLPKEFAPFEEAAFALKPNEVSGVVRTSLGLHVLQAGERKAAGDTPLAEVKDDIRNELAELRAADRLTKALDAVQEKVAGGEELAKAAPSEGIAVKSTEFFAKEAPPADLGLSEQAVAALFGLKKGEGADAPLSTQDGFIIARISDLKPAGFEPLDAVKDVIKDRLVADGALRLAKAKAEETLKEMETPDGLKKVLATYKDKIATSQPFTRQGFIPGLGMAPLLAQTAFDTTESAGWFKAAYSVSEGYVLAGLDKRIAADASLWDKEKDRWVATLAQSKQSELFKAYLLAVQQSAKVEIVNEAILGGKLGGKADLQ